MEKQVTEKGGNWPSQTLKHTRKPLYFKERGAGTSTDNRKHNGKSRTHMENNI